MATYRFTVEEIGIGAVEVEANSEDEARGLVDDALFNGEYEPNEKSYDYKVLDCEEIVDEN